MKHWRTDMLEICSAIRRRKSRLKILLKTKNERLLLKRWLEHHMAIVGVDNIIIFDHGSDDENVLQLYADYSDAVICGFSGFLDNVHCYEVYAPLYEALKESTDFFIFLDTDEFLVWMQGSRFIEGDNIVHALVGLGVQHCLPGTWLTNVAGYDDHFRCESEKVLYDGLRWGKPIVWTGALLHGILLHNASLNQRGLLKASACRNIFVLHLKDLSVPQRIQSNLHKLISFGVINALGDLDALTKVPLDCVEAGSKRAYVEELQRLVRLPADFKADPGGSIRLVRPGEIVYGDERQRDWMSAFLNFTGEQQPGPV